MYRFVPLALAALVAACDRPGEPSAEHNPLGAPPIDSTRVRSVEETSGWRYRREVEADLDGDGRPERVVLTAEVEVDGAGRAIWEDGHRWAVYVEQPGAERTLVYAAFVPNGFVEAAISRADSDRTRSVLVVERTPEQLRMLEIDYEAPGRARLASAGYYHLEQWVPGFATLGPETPPSRSAP